MPPVIAPARATATAENEMLSPPAKPLNASPTLARLSSSRPSSTTDLSISPASFDSAMGTRRFQQLCPPNLAVPVEGAFTFWFQSYSYHAACILLCVQFLKKES